jgi:hypothetical protein
MTRRSHRFFTSDGEPAWLVALIISRITSGQAQD